jgi:hypothetical protein
LHKTIENFWQNRPLTMKNKSRNNANAGLLVRLEPKPPLSTVIARKNLVGALTMLNGGGYEAAFWFQWPSPATVDGDFQTHFVPAGRLCRFPFGQNSPRLAVLMTETKKHFIPNETKPFENQLKSVPCLVP